MTLKHVSFDEPGQQDMLLSISPPLKMWMVFMGRGYMGRGFTFGGQELGCAFGAAVCKIQVMKHYIEYL